MHDINDFMLCLGLKDGAKFLFDKTMFSKGKNRESGPGGKFRQEFYRREIPLLPFFLFA